MLISGSARAACDLHGRTAPAPPTPGRRLRDAQVTELLEPVLVEDEREDAPVEHRLAVLVGDAEGGEDGLERGRLELGHPLGDHREVRGAEGGHLPVAPGLGRRATRWRRTHPGWCRRPGGRTRRPTAPCPARCTAPWRSRDARRSGSRPTRWPPARCCTPPASWAAASAPSRRGRSPRGRGRCPARRAAGRRSPG